MTGLLELLERVADTPLSELLTDEDLAMDGIVARLVRDEDDETAVPIAAFTSAI